MPNAITKYKNWEQCQERIIRLKVKLQKRYPAAYICVAVKSGTFGVGYRSVTDRDGHLAAFADYEQKYGKISTSTLFIGYKL